MSKQRVTRTRGSHRWLPYLAGALAVALPLIAWLVPATADDGPMVRHPVSRTPDMESEDAQLSMMQFYVPASSRNGEAVVLEYYADRDGDNQPDELIETREYAKPLVTSYFDEVPVGSYSSAFKSAAFGRKSGVEVGPDIRRDAFGAFSLDDGKTWKERNLSESALETSFTLANGIEYPGDVPEVVHGVAGNKVLVAWTSKYCAQGSPRYSVKADTDLDGNGELDDPLYPDLFDVAGNQGSIDYAEWMHHGTYPFAEVGEIPFSCVWTARGTVQQVVNPQTGALQWGVLWRKAERLTSGKRDAYYLALDGVEGAGFVLAWQEDPEGLRPGYGEGPGVGWSGATVNHKTDIWYSHIGWTDFDLMQDADGSPTLDPSVLENNKPKVYERMAMPLRLTDNFNCLSDRVDQDGNPHPAFCFEDFDGNGTADFCATTMPWTNTQGVTMNICVTEDGRLLNGQIGSSRTRLMLEGYTQADGTKSAWVVLAYEETKGLGAGHSDVVPLDIGKDVMYHSFDMSEPELVAPGTMLNMPETDPLSDSENPALLPLILNDAGEYQYQTTIGRRPSLVVQPGSKIAEAAATGQTYGMTSAILLYKDGPIRQGGPSDIFMRRIVLPAGFNPAYDNPYDPEYLACDLADTAIVTSSPHAYPASAYPNGVCLRGAINVSGTTPLTFEALDNTDSPEMPADHPDFGTEDCSACHGIGYEPGEPTHGITQRVLTWEQTAEDLGDEAWENKYEVAKGHRGFIDGDFVMLMYAHSPNWLATSHGHEPYNLFIRRSFDGGVTWTTTPAALGGTGTTYDQVFGVGDRVWTVTRTLGAGEFEPARNVSQLTSNKETVLDPRYSPTNMGTQTSVERILLPDGTYQTVTGGLYPDDLRDPSKFFAVFETGDATTVLLGGEADPLDLFASRATVYGDFWDTEDVFAQGKGLWEERWDWLENKKDVLSGEASIAASPGGDYLYTVWNEWMEYEDGHVYESDPMFRRLWWDEALTIVADAGTYYAAPGEMVTLTGSATYYQTSLSLALRSGSLLTYAWDLDNDGFFEIEGQEVRVPATGASQAVALRVCAEAGGCDIDQGWINPDPFTPRVWRIRPEPVPVLVGTPMSVTGKVNMPGQAETASVVWTWGDGTAPEAGTLPEELQGQGAAFVAGGHSYAEAGVYRVTLTVTDESGRDGFDYEYVAVYDPAAGAITGEGIIPSGMGEAYFQLDAQYDKNKGYLKGQAVIEVEAAGLAFAATGLDWLAVAPDGTAHLQGAGTLNGKGGYDFLLTVFDDKEGGDRARVRIWHGGAGKSGHLAFDSQPGDPIGAAATAPVQGNVTLHVK